MAAVAALSLAIASAMACTWAKLVEADSECTAVDRASYGSEATAEADLLVTHAAKLAASRKQARDNPSGRHVLNKWLREREREREKEIKKGRKEGRKTALQEQCASQASTWAGTAPGLENEQDRARKAETVLQCCSHMHTYFLAGKTYDGKMLPWFSAGHKYSQQRSYAYTSRVCSMQEKTLYWTLQ